MKGNLKDFAKQGDFNTVLDSIADYVSSDAGLAKEFLREEGVDVEKQLDTNMAFLRSLQSKAREKLAVKA